MDLDQEISMIKTKLAALPAGHPDIGHLTTILVGLTGERAEQNAKREMSSPLYPLIAVGDALLKVAPHNVLMMFTKSMSSGDARPNIITHPSQRGRKDYLKDIY